MRNHLVALVLFLSLSALALAEDEPKPDPGFNEPTFKAAESGRRRTLAQRGHRFLTMNRPTQLVVSRSIRIIRTLYGLAVEKM